MKLHLPTSLRSALFACFSAACALTTTLFSGSLAACLIVSSQSYASYNDATTTFEGTNNSGINPTASTYNGVETLIFNMGAAGTGNYFDQASWTYDGNIQIGEAGATETGLCLNNGHSNQTDIFSGKVTGTGLLSKTGAGRGLTVAFTGDVSDFSGGIRLGSTAAFTLRFGNGSSPVSGATAEHGVSGTGDITFCGSDKDTLAYNYSTVAPVYITNRISTNAGTTSKVALNGSAHYVLTKDTDISSLTLADNTTLHIGTQNHSSATVLGALTMGAGAAVHVDNGSLEVLNAASLVGTYAVGAEGVLHLSRTAALEGALTVVQCGALSIGALSGFGEMQTPAAGENGFAGVNGKLSILTGSADKLQALAGTKVLHNGKSFALAGDGSVTISEMDYSAYYFRSGEENLSALVAESDNQLTRVEMSTGAKLVVDSGAVQGNYSVETERSVALSEFGASTIAADIHIDNLSSTTPVTVASGATLSIGSTAADNGGDIDLSADSHLVFESAAPTAMSVGNIINTVDGKDDFRRSVYVGEQVALQARSFVNAWGMESLTVDGEMTISGLLSNQTSGIRVGNSPANNLITGKGHITADSLIIGNASDYNTISVHELTINGAASIERSTTISGGTTVLLGTTTASAELNLTGGHLILGDELSDTATLSGDINLSAGAMTINGTTSLGSNLHQTGGTLTINGELMQTSTLTVSGTMALNGTLKADSVSLCTVGDVTYSEGVNGYLQGTFVLVNKGDGSLSLQLGEQGTVLLDGANATSCLSSDAAGNILLADTVGSVYHVFEGEAVYGGDASTVDTARTMGFALHGGSLSLLAEHEGGHHLNLTADADVTLGAGVSLSAASVTGAEHLTLSGAGTYVVDTLEEIAAVTRSEAWTGTTLINDRIYALHIDDVTKLSHSGNLCFRQQDSSVLSDAGGAIDNFGFFSLSRNSDVTFRENVASRVGGAISNDAGGIFWLERNGNVTFSGNMASSDTKVFGGAIFNGGSATFMLSDNGSVTFSGNTASVSGDSAADSGDGAETSPGDTFYDYAASIVDSGGGAIYNWGAFELCGNGNVIFSENAADGGGAILNDSGGHFTLSDNKDVTFIGNAAPSVCGGAIYNWGAFELCGNGNIIFSGNAAGGGGAILNGAAATFALNDNGDVTFSGNMATIDGGAISCFGAFTLNKNGNVTFSGNSAVYGGAIYNDGTFTLSGNGDVLFEKNAEVNNGIYRLRSIYSGGTLNLSASEGKSILFKDSVYASGAVNLNPEGTGDIVFTGISTEADLREVKGGVDGTAQEILNSRTSEIATNAKLYGGRLIVEDGAILKGEGITFTEGANATLRLKGGTLNETGYTIAVSSGSGLEFEGENALTASSVSLAGGSFLSFILDEAQAAVNWDADLDIQGGLSLNLTHENKPVRDTYVLLAMQDGNTVTGWDDAALTISGTTAEHLVWENNTLYYRPMLVQENGDTTLDKDVETDAAGGTIGGKDDVSINGNGHTLTVKNEVQLVQMALKNGTVKLEGENNGIVSVTLTEGGELVLTAGAGLKTGDIISMVASGKGELIISGDITLDNKGMKGKAGEQSTLSHANAQVLGDATISNVRVEDSTIDLAEGSTVGFEHVVLAATTRITDDPATAKLDDVTAELVMGVNASLTGRDLLLAGTTLAQSGNTGAALTLSDDASVLMLEATTFDSVTLTGTSLLIELAGLEVELFDGADWIGISFTSGTDYATFDPSLAVALSIEGVCYQPGYIVSGADSPTTVYFRSIDEICTTPEPATATLSLLALAALAARRKRK